MTDLIKRDDVLALLDRCVAENMAACDALPRRSRTSFLYEMTQPDLFYARISAVIEIRNAVKELVAHPTTTEES